jgi:hypothetical protein
MANLTMVTAFQLIHHRQVIALPMNNELEIRRNLIYRWIYQTEYPVSMSKFELIAFRVRSRNSIHSVATVDMMMIMLSIIIYFHFSVTFH